MVCVKVVCERERVTKLWQSGVALRATNGDQVRQCHACHVKRRWMSPSATPATQSGAVPRATNGDQARHQVQQAPRLPRQTQVDVSKCHAWHVKRRWMSPSATPATQSGAAPWCVKDGDHATKMVCDKVVCERWCVTKLCAKDGV